MSLKQFGFVMLAFALLVGSGLACNASTETRVPPTPIDTVTPYAPQTSSTQQATVEAPEATSEAPEATSPPTSPTEEEPEPTEELEPTQTPEPTRRPSPTQTPEPTTPVSEGPLDFDPPQWVHAWEKREGGGVQVTVKVLIQGGAPPFTISYDGGYHGESTAREYLLDFPHAGCKAIVHNITVKSADGQTISHDFYLGGEKLPWCD